MPVLAERDEVPGKPGKLDLHGLSFRGLRSSDLDLMHRWLNAPHVRRWWYDEGTSYQEIEPKTAAAIKAYEKAGFRYFKKIQVPGEPEPEYLMKLTREEFEGDGVG